MCQLPRVSLGLLDFSKGKVGRFFLLLFVRAGGQAYSVLNQVCPVYRLFQPSSTNSHSRQAPRSPSRLGQMRQGGYTDEGWSGVEYHAQATTSCLSRLSTNESIVSNSG